MKLLSKRDVIFAVITGLIAGIIAWAILGYAWLIVTIPILWLLGVQLIFLGKWIAFFDQFGKFSAIGFTNFAVDAGVLNLLMYLTGIVGGIGFLSSKASRLSLQSSTAMYGIKHGRFKAKERRVRNL